MKTRYIDLQAALETASRSAYAVQDEPPGPMQLQKSLGMPDIKCIDGARGHGALLWALRASTPSQMLLQVNRNLLDRTAPPRCAPLVLWGQSAPSSKGTRRRSHVMDQ